MSEKCTIECYSITTIEGLNTTKDFRDKRSDLIKTYQGIIQISAGRMELSYDDEYNDNCSYIGKEEGEGQWCLKCLNNDMDEIASLHCFRKSSIFEGYYDVKNVDKGFWRITVAR